MKISTVLNKFLYLFADCMLTKGFTKSMICDISRKKAYFIDNCYHDLLVELKGKSIGEVADMLEDDASLMQYEDFLNYIIDMELGELVDCIDEFPDIEIQWDHPSKITNALIDVRAVDHDFKDIFTQLNDLFCQHIQIRAYRILSCDEILNIIFHSKGLNIRSLLFITKYEQDAISQLYQIVKDYTYVRFLLYDFHGKSPNETSDFYYDRIQYTKQQINSCESCGIINKSSFTISTVQSYMENLMFNGCLNRKISIDEMGNIKNCPSMTSSFGNVEQVTLNSVIEIEDFNKLWRVNKDQINICRDCEYRRLCSDCRAYTVDQSSIYSKPSKCMYDPYAGIWTDVSSN